MVDTVFSFEILAHNDSRFLQDYGLEDYAKSISETFRPFQFYNGCPMKDILLVSKKENQITVQYPNAGDKITLDDIPPPMLNFLSDYPGDNMWIIDRKLWLKIYDFNTKDFQGSWNAVCRQDANAILGWCPKEKKPMKVHNGTKYTSLAFCIYYMNNYFWNTTSLPVSEYGVKTAMKLICKIFGIVPYGSAYFDWNKLEKYCNPWNRKLGLEDKQFTELSQFWAEVPEKIGVKEGSPRKLTVPIAWIMPLAQLCGLPFSRGISMS